VALLFQRADDHFWQTPRKVEEAHRHAYRGLNSYVKYCGEKNFSLDGVAAFGG
jgi:hypothetical protein